MDGFLELDGCLRTGDLASFGSVGGMEDWPGNEAIVLTLKFVLH